MKYFFTADEHYYHKNIITYCNRPFKDINEMNEELIKRHNEIVSQDDITFHIGDFTLKSSIDAENITRRLNGKHIFIQGSHDKWMDKNHHEIWEGIIEKQYLVACHYAMRTWGASHYNSWQLFGHSHGKLNTIGKQLDVGVDTHNFYPYSFEEIKNIMKKKEDNFNFIK